MTENINSVKIKAMAIKVDTRRVIGELLKINGDILIDIIFDLYDAVALKEDFSEYFNAEINTENMIAVLGELVRVIARKDRTSSAVFAPVMRRNRRYIEFYGYHRFSIEKLREVFSRDMVPSLHREGVSPQMMILYWFSNNMFNHSMIPALIEDYNVWREKAEEEARKCGGTVETTGHIPGIDELSYRMYLEENLKGIESVDWQEIAERFGCEYDSRNRVFNGLRRGILLYFDAAIGQARDAQNRYEAETAVVRNYMRRAYNLMEKTVQEWRRYTKAMEDNRRLSMEIKALKKELRDLNEKYSALDASRPDSGRLTELMKENYYLKLTVERLEQRIDELERAGEINRQIEDNIEIHEEQKPAVSPELPEFQTIAVVGGKWNSHEKGKLEEALRTCEIKFIEAEKTIARIDTIANADFVVFDTSRNAHKYYYLVKERANRVLLTNRSTAESVIELFKR